MQSFESFSIPQSLASSLKKMNYETPTPIQAQSIGPALEGKDIIACAQTGTGKTAAFCIPIISHILNNEEAHALILTPTRELAAQIEEVIHQLLQNNRDIYHALLIGGASMRPQFQQLSRGPRIVVATPGRLIDHMERGSIGLSAVTTLVLDEADRMLDMGFEPQLKEILKQVPKERQTLMFSATYPPNIQRMTKNYMQDPIQVKVSDGTEAVAAITQIARDMRGGEKNTRLVDELVERKEGAVLVFTRTKQRTEKVTKFLMGAGFRVDYIHGDRSQRQRMDAIENLKKGSCRILVATDVAARGLDISNIRHVINYDLPQSPDDYIHRIGRTGRAGASGEAVSFVSPEERKMWNMIQKLVAQKKSKVASNFKRPKNTKE